MTSPTEPGLYPQADGPLWEDVSKFIRRRGDPGVHLVESDEEGATIVAYNSSRQLVGVLLVEMSDIVPGEIAGIWVVVRPDSRRRGWGSRMYQCAIEAGIDIEAGSDFMLTDGTMTPDGYDFQVGRRAKRG